MKESTIRYNNKKINILTLPKGLVLFKCIIDKQDNNADFYGIQTGANSYCLPRAHNVFFYPQPFIIDSNLYFRSPNRKFYIYKLTYDISIISLLSASFSEQDAIDAGVLVKCNTLTFCEGLTGKSYDTCISHDFMTRYPGIIGCTRIVPADNNHYTSAIASKKYIFDKSIFFNKTSFPAGVPEIFMFPLRKHIHEDIFYNNITKHNGGYNYALIKELSHQPYRVDGLYKYMRSMIKSKKFIYNNGWYYYNNNNI